MKKIKTIKYGEIRQLFDRFMDGETSIEEERKFYNYFASGVVDDRLADYKAMMIYLWAVLPPAQRSLWQSRVVRFTVSIAAQTSRDGGIGVLWMG